MDWVSEKIQVKCPFYISHTFPRGKGATSISCEKLPEIEGNCTMQICFSDKKALDAHMAAYCKCFSFARCPLYKHIAEGLEKEEGKREERRTKEAKKRSWIDEEIARSRKAKRY